MVKTNFKFLIAILVFTFCILNFLGCATMRRSESLEMQGLRNQISALEAQLQSKDEEIGNLKDALTTASQIKEISAKKKVIGEVKSRPSLKQIQVALRNAGYEPGAIDGKMGRLTKEAVRSFQRANNLAVDGKVGKQTWKLLSKYLYQKVK